jgi:hypothetical protein
MTHKYYVTSIIEMSWVQGYFLPRKQDLRPADWLFQSPINADREQGW